jgi:hypothetical protein
MFELRFLERKLKYWASRYQVPQEEKLLIDVEVPKVHSRGHIAKHQFLRFCKWKTPRSKRICRRNTESLVIETTGVALSTTDEELKIGVLRVLAGVEWPTASVLLHLCDRAPYPILDFRALWSVSVASPPPYNFDYGGGTPGTFEASRGAAAVRCARSTERCGSTRRSFKRAEVRQHLAPLEDST